METRENREISLFKSFIPIIGLVIIMYFTVFVFGADAHLALIFSAALAALVAMSEGYKWEQLEKGIVNSLFVTLQSMMILWIVGMIIGTWTISGIVPSIIYYGLKFISPKLFLATACIIASIVSLATGSSWSTIGTVGIALMGVGIGLGAPPPIVAGAIVSGAYFGDKMSPLSDSTNMAPAVAGTDVFTHIRHMLYTTVPALVLSLIIYLILGFQYEGSSDLTTISTIMNGLENSFSIGPHLLIPPVLIIIMIAMKMPAVPSLIISTLVGGFTAMIFQGEGLGAIMESAMYGYVSNSGDLMIDDLLTGGGMISMAYALTMLFSAMAFAGVMDASGMIDNIVGALARFAKSIGGLIATTLFTAFFINVITGEQYLSIILPGKMFKPEYDKRGLEAKNLSRALEDAGTITSPLIPWGACGVFVATTLGVSTWDYIPYAFLNYSIPIISLIYGFTGFSINYTDKNTRVECETTIKQGI